MAKLPEKLIGALKAAANIVLKFAKLFNLFFPEVKSFWSGF
jgi:hypothetical protein